MTALTRLGLRLKDLTHRDAAPPARGACVLAVNFGGDGLELFGHRWWGQAEAESHGVRTPGVRQTQVPLVPVPHAGPVLRRMLSSLVFRARTLDVHLPVPAGPHDLVIWLSEGYQAQWHNLSLSVDGKPLAQGLGHLPLGGWQACGPYRLDGPAGERVLRLDSGSDTVDAHLMGLSLHRA